jgi:hypothetical protein
MRVSLHRTKHIHGFQHRFAARQWDQLAYLDAVNLGAEGGLIFSATITTGTSSVAPEPSGLVLLGSGLLLILVALMARPRGMLNRA